MKLNSSKPRYFFCSSNDAYYKIVDGVVFILPRNNDEWHTSFFTKEDVVDVVSGKVKIDIFTEIPAAEFVLLFNGSL